MEVLADFAVRAGAVWFLGIVAAGFLLRGRSAGLREAVLRASTWVVLLLPLAVVVAPRWAAAPWGTQEARAARPTAPAPARAGSTGTAAQPAGPLAEPRPTRTVPRAAEAAPSDAAPFASARLALGAWVAGAALVLWPALAGLLALARLSRRARPVDDAHALASLDELRRAFGVRRPVCLTHAGDVPVPLSFEGLPGRPARIVVPTAALEWPAERLRTALAHELAHIARGDGWSGLRSRAALASSWWWPHAWWCWRRQLALTERACDDRVLLSGERPSTYAAHLLALAPRAPRPWAVATSMARAGGLEERVRALLDEGRPRAGAGRRARVVLALAACGVLAAAGGSARQGTQESGAPAQDAEAGSPGPSRKALARGLDALLAMQADDGSWSGSIGYKLNSAYRVTGEEQPHVGVTALALEALLAAGVAPGEGPRGEALARGLQFLVACGATDPGHVQRGGTRMTCHALATAALARAYAATGDGALREPAQLAVAFSERTQNQAGGWRYAPYATESDLLNTVEQKSALDAARAAGLDVHVTTLARAKAHVARHLAPPDAARPGFRYTDDPYGRVTVATTAAGLFALEGEDALDPELARGLLDALPEKARAVSEAHGDSALAWYARDCVAQALRAWSTEPADAARWTAYRDAQALELVKRQRADGRWTCEGGPGDAYATAVACRLLAW